MPTSLWQDEASLRTNPSFRYTYRMSSFTTERVLSVLLDTQDGASLRTNPSHSTSSDSMSAGAAEGGSGEGERSAVDDDIAVTAIMFPPSPPPPPSPPFTLSLFSLSFSLPALGAGRACVRTCAGEHASAGSNARCSHVLITVPGRVTPASLFPTLLLLRWWYTTLYRYRVGKKRLLSAVCARGDA